MLDSRKKYSYLRMTTSNLAHRLQVLLSAEIVEIAQGFQCQGTSAVELQYHNWNSDKLRAWDNLAFQDRTVL